MTKIFPRSCSSFFLLLFLLLLKEARSSPRQLKLHEFQTKLQQKKATFRTTSFATPKIAGVIYPVDYGADPTGEKDSASAISDAIRDATKLQNSGHELLPGITDLGGVIVDLQGGSFRIGNPIRFPPGIGNILVQGGSLRASTTFPGDRHLIELWAPGSPKDYNSGDHFSDRKDLNTGMKYEDITFQDILFDSSYRGGGLLVIDSARIRVMDCFFLHFTTQGILVVRGHETLVSTSFLGQHPTVGGDRLEKNYTGTAIDIASTDNAITDVAIFSAATGIILRGQANIVTGAHCYNKATYFGGVGILVKSGKNRIVDPYLDYNGIVMEDPDQVHVSNGFFLGGGNIVLKSVKGQISGLTIVNNIFCGDSKKMFPSVKLEGHFTSIDQVVIDQNVVDGMRLKTTSARMTVDGNGTQWVADFSAVLVFPGKINHVQYSFYTRTDIGDGFPAHAVTNVSGNVVVIESQEAANAVVSVAVDQHNMAGESSFVI